MLVRVVRAIALASASALCFVALWTLLPASSAAFLPLTVGAPELTPWILVASCLTAVTAAIVRGSLAARVAVMLALAAGTLAVRVLVQIPGTARSWEAAMTSVIGTELPAAAPARAVAARQQRPVQWSELLTGVVPRLERAERGIEFARPGGEPLTLTVYRSAAGRPAPVVIQIYGGAWQRGTPDDNAAHASALARAGYLVVALDYRHAPRWRWPAQLDDVRDGIRWVVRHAESFGGDVSKMALVGRSSGSQLAMLAPHDPSMPAFAAVVGYYGPVDLTGGYREPPSPDPIDVRAVEAALIGGTPDERPDAYRAASPITFADRPHPPTLIIAAGRDHIVEPRFSRRLNERLAQSGTSILLVVPWGDHAFDAVPFGPGAQLAQYHVERFLAWAFWR